jgi:hypothetical protein
MIPVQITNNNLQSTNMGPGFGLINGKPGEACNGFNGNLNSWEYGLKNEFKQNLIKQYENVGKLAQLDTVNSPYYTQVQVDPAYINFLQIVSDCKLKN